MIESYPFGWLHIVSLVRLKYFILKNRSYEETGLDQAKGRDVISYQEMTGKR